jgi:hypothetical protein
MTGMKVLDPKKFGLHYSTVLEEIDEQTMALVMNRKSRIVMADGKKILDKVQKIQHKKPGVRVLLKTSAPVCSKTLALLAEQGVKVYSLNSEL